MSLLNDCSCWRRYGDQLKQARNVGIKKGLYTSIAIGSLYFTIFCMYALGFWWVQKWFWWVQKTYEPPVTVEMQVIQWKYILLHCLQNPCSLITPFEGMDQLYLWIVSCRLEMFPQFSILLGSFALGHALPELHTFATAMGSAVAVFDILDRVRTVNVIQISSKVDYICHCYIEINYWRWFKDERDATNHWRKYWVFRCDLQLPLKTRYPGM